MLLRLQPYDLTSKYRQGKEVLLADPLSRLSPRVRGPVKDMDVQVNLVQFSSDKMKELRDATDKDCELIALCETIISGLPDTIKKVPSALKPYWPYQDELSVEDGLVMKSDRVVLPKVGTDIFHYNNEDYLIMCDYYNKFPFIKKLAKMDSQTVADCTKTKFSEQGIPERVVSDNGRQYDYTTYRQFAKDWGFDHVTSSPHNGLVQRQIQTVKITLTKAKETGHDPKLALLSLWSTPIDNQLPSPGELLYQQKLKSDLPVRARNTDPNSDVIASRLKSRQDTQKAYHDTCARNLPPLITGQHVRIQDHTSKRWNPGVVTSKTSESRSYNVLTPNGNILRRNSSHICGTGEKHTRVNMDDSEPPELPQPAPQMPVVVAVPPYSPNTSGSASTPTPQVKEPDGYTTQSGRTVRQRPRLVL